MFCHAIISTGKRSCMFRPSAGHGSFCTFHWHRATTGHRPGWPAGFVAPCCAPVFGSNDAGESVVDWDSTMAALLARFGSTDIDGAPLA